MDVTPQELRGSEIKEAWRGYHRDEVDELLERAAVTIEHLSQQLATASSRPVPESSVAAPVTVTRDDADMLQRTLMLAQRAADDAVNEAHAEARRLIEESEARAQALVGEAEASARRISESERRRLESEMQDLVARRDALSIEADAIEDYARAYRERVRAAIESDLHRLGNGTIAPPKPRPQLSEVDVPVREPEPEAWDTDTPETDDDGDDGGAGGNETRAISIDEPAPGPFAERASSPVAAPPRPAEMEWPPPASAPASHDGTPSAAAEPAWLAGKETTTDGLSRSEMRSWDQATTTHEPFSSDTPMEATPVDSDSLDDDAFFASLRDAAVHDDERVGPRDEEPMPFFDDELADERRRFRRRR